MLLACRLVRFPASSTNWLTQKYISSWMHYPEDRYKPQQTISIKFPSSKKTIEVEIVKAFTPFTNSAALVVDTSTMSHQLPKQLLLKLADRRAIERQIAGMAWTPERESDFHEGIRRHMERKSRPPKPISVYELNSKNPIWIQELHYWSHSNQHHLREREAYERLVEAQRLGIVPHYYGAVRIQMDASGLHPALDHIDGLLLEYIPGRTMASVVVGKDISVDDAEDVSQKILQLGRHIRRYGITHNDIHLNNILLRKADNSPVLIDWGSADFSVADAPLAKRWEDECVYSEWIHWRSHLQGTSKGLPWHAFETPVSNESIEKYPSYFEQRNRYLENLPQHVKDKFYYEDKVVDPKDGLRWRVRPGVRTRPFNEPVPEE